ncbi:MAG: putative ABC transporter permease [Chloroflexota bacterium]|nr:putative ABC transporter permease [Chloroflexota bacterium]
MVGAPMRALLYGLTGSLVESAFTSGVASFGRARITLHGPSTWVMVPLYGLAQLLFEPVHDAVRGRPWWHRGAVYAAGIFTLEAVAGWTLRAVTGRCPWDYSGRSPLAVDGVIRLDYAPLWAGLGLATERLHDALTVRRAG